MGYELTKARSAVLAKGLLAAHGAFVLLAFAGMWFSRGAGERILIILTLFLYFTVMHNLFAPMPRFRLPIEPFLIPFGILSLQKLWEKLRPRHAL